MDKRTKSANTFIDQPQGKENSTDVHIGAAEII